MIEITVHDLFNYILLVVLVKYIYINKNKSKNMEHMDMGLFDSGSGNYKTTTSSKELKQKLEALESNLLIDKFHRFLNRLKRRDRKAVEDELSPPEQRVEAQQYIDFDTDNLRVNIRTRGEPDNYQMVGLLYNKDMNKNYQLFGRRIYPGAYEWEYYIRGRDAGGLDFKFPIDSKQELMDGSSINLPIDNNTYQLKIYNYDQPRYNPYSY